MPVTSPRGALAALAAAAMFGLSAPLSKTALATVDPQLMAGLLYLSAGIGLSGVRWLQGGGGPFAPIERADRPWLLGSILVGGVLAPFSLMYGLAHSPAAAASLLLNTETLFTVGIAALLFGERVTPRVIIGLAVILTGAVILSWPEGPVTASWPALAVVAACWGWGLDNSLTCKITRMDPTQVAAIKGWSAGMINIALAVSLGAAAPSPTVFAAAAAIGFFAYGLSLVLFVRALRAVGAARTGAYFATAPFIGSAASALLLGEPITPGLGLAGGLMALGVAVTLSERPAVHP